MLKDVQKITEELLKLLEVDATVKVSEKEDNISVIVKPEGDAGLLIGAHGSTLAALQSFINLAIKQKTGEWARIVLDIGDWREKQDAQLEELADQAAMRARETGEPQHLYNLSPAQRRVVHMALSKMKDILTESQGEGTGRYLVVTAS